MEKSKKSTAAQIRAKAQLRELRKVEEWKEKAEKWDRLGAKIEKMYVDENGEPLPDDDESFDLGTIGEVAAMAYGWL